MVNTEKIIERSGPLRPLKARSERRIKEANELAESNPVAVLKEKVRHRDPDADITVTKPRLHPFAKVRVEAKWNISYKDSVLTTSAGNIPVQSVSGKGVEIAFLKKSKDGYHGVIVKSGNGEELIPNQIGPDAANTITAAINNPLPFDKSNSGIFTALAKRSRRAI